MKTSIYVDGFNLYYGSLRGTPYKWLNIHALCEKILPRISIHQIKYFTARVQSRPHDPTQDARQDLYFRALRTLPNTSIIEGTFLTSKVRMPLAADPKRKVEVVKVEEKGSDVNLAVHLVRDGFKSEFQQALILSNDSDLAEAVRVVRSELGLPVGILCPYKRVSVVLQKHASFVRPIRQGPLSVSQFPHLMRDAHGDFHIPESWK